MRATAARRPGRFTRGSGSAIRSSKPRAAPVHCGQRRAPAMPCPTAFHAGLQNEALHFAREQGAKNGGFALRFPFFSPPAQKRSVQTQVIRRRALDSPRGPSRREPAPTAAGGARAGSSGCMPRDTRLRSELCVWLYFCISSSKYNRTIPPLVSMHHCSKSKRFFALLLARARPIQLRPLPEVTAPAQYDHPAAKSGVVNSLSVLTSKTQLPSGTSSLSGKSLSESNSIVHIL